MLGASVTQADDIVAGNTAETLPENRLHYPALDGVRAVAFLLVFGQHYLNLPWGWTGVDLFFVLSGFLITGILFDTRSREHRVRDFYVRRVLRIFPLYYGVLLVIFALTPLAHWQWNGYWLAWPLFLGNVVRFVHPYSTDPAYLAVTPGALVTGGQLVFYIGHFWSLAVEEQFYLVWPAVVFLVRDRRRLLWMCAVAVVVLPVLRIWSQYSMPYRFVQLDFDICFTPLRLDSFLMGGAAALLLRGESRRWLIAAARWGGAALAGVAAIYLSLTLRRHGYGLPGWWDTWGLSVVGLLATSLVVMALVRESWSYRVLSLRPLRWLGRLSYGAYVFHVIAIRVFQRMAIRLGRGTADRGRAPAAGDGGDGAGGHPLCGMAQLPLSGVAVSELEGTLCAGLAEEQADDRGAHEVGHGAGEHGAQAEAGEIVAAGGDEGADAADLHANAAEVSEAAEGEGGDREGARGEGRLLRAELGEGDELVEDGAGCPGDCRWCGRRARECR